MQPLNLSEGIGAKDVEKDESCRPKIMLLPERKWEGLDKKVVWASESAMDTVFPTATLPANRWRGQTIWEWNCLDRRGLKLYASNDHFNLFDTVSRGLEVVLLAGDHRSSSETSQTRLKVAGITTQIGQSSRAGAARRTAGTGLKQGRG